MPTGYTRRRGRGRTAGALPIQTTEAKTGPVGPVPLRWLLERSRQIRLLALLDGLRLFLDLHENQLRGLVGEVLRHVRSRRSPNCGARLEL